MTSKIASVFAIIIVYLFCTVFSIIYIFKSGTNQYTQVCQDIHSNKIDQTQQNIYGFENCLSEGRAVFSGYENFILLITFIVGGLPVVLMKNFSKQDLLKSYFFTIGVFLSLVLLNLILLSNFYHIGVEGFQDAGITVAKSNSYIEDFLQNGLSSSFFFSTIVVLVFSGMFSLGHYFSGRYYLAFKENYPKFISIPIYYGIAFLATFIAMILSFPITLWTGLLGM